MVKCPYCGYEGEHKLLKMWRYRWGNVYLYQCPSCSRKFKYQVDSESKSERYIMSVHKTRSYLIITTVVISFLVFLLLLNTYLYSPTAPSISGSTVFSKDPADVIRDYLSYVNPSIRDKAVSILNSYIDYSSTIYSQRIYVSAGSWKNTYLYAFEDIKYKIRVYVQDTCVIGRCDIYVELRNGDNKVIKSFGRITNLDYEAVLPEGIYYIYLSNTYSTFTSKTVDVTITAYFTRYMLNDDVYKTITIGLWVAENINYVSDPRGFEYIMPPEETLKTRAGDCDDYAVLLASMYRSVGLEAAVGLIDTNGDGKVDHATALVYFNKDPDIILDKLKAIAQVLGIKTERITYFKDEKGGIWLIIDPPMTYGSKEPWNVEHVPYKLIKLIKP